MCVSWEERHPWPFVIAGSCSLGSFGAGLRGGRFLQVPSWSLPCRSRRGPLTVLGVAPVCGRLHPGTCPARSGGLGPSGSRSVPPAPEPRWAPRGLRVGSSSPGDRASGVLKLWFRVGLSLPGRSRPGDKSGPCRGPTARGARPA